MDWELSPPKNNKGNKLSINLVFLLHNLNEASGGRLKKVLTVLFWNKYKEKLWMFCQRDDSRSGQRLIRVGMVKKYACVR